MPSFPLLGCSPVPSGWQIFDGDAGKVPAGADVLIPLDEWRERRAVWLARAGRLGVVLSASDAVSSVGDDRGELSMIAVQRGAWPPLVVWPAPAAPTPVARATSPAGRRGGRCVPGAGARRPAEAVPA